MATASPPAMIEVLRPGVITLVQDLGRYGFQHDGVPVCGVMDETAHRLANWLVGNPARLATLETTGPGLALRFHEPAVVAVCGADLDARLDNQPIALDSGLAVPAGSVLSFEGMRCGLRAYVAVAGGFQTPLVMGSASTCVRAGFGGVEGRALQAGDWLHHGRDCITGRGRDCAGRRRDAPVPPLPQIIDQQTPLRLVPGREFTAFTPQARNLIVQQPYVLSRRSDRMGYRLEGPALMLKAPVELLSEAVTFGTVQVPPDGQPIVLMADRQTTGGYPRIAAVAHVDLPRLAQAIPGRPLWFSWITLTEAQQLMIEQARRFAMLDQGERHAAN